MLEPSSPRWALACRTRTGGPWHIHFANQIFISFEEAASKAFEFNDQNDGYLHKPVKVQIEVLEEKDAV